MKAWPLGELLKASAAEIKKTRVDCGTCPVSIQCATDDGGNGWKFDCCGATAVDAPLQGEGNVLLVMDCAENRFSRNTRELPPQLKRCPLCSGDIVKGHLLDLTLHYRYVPTVHMKVEPKDRVETWKQAKPAAVALQKRVEARRKG